MQFDELETRFGFVGGSYSNYVEYLNRKDMDPTLWHYVLQQDVQATAGISTVPKKSGRQRKLLMQCAANCMYAPADTRSSLGMFGGGALSQVYVPGGEIAAASFDESNAFTAVVTPRWMWNWCAAPPVRAGDVWSRFSSALRGHCNAATWVSPCYTRLAMGGTHSVHILMTINLEIVGRALWSSRKLGAFAAGPVAESRPAHDADGEFRDLHELLRDDDDWRWHLMQQRKRQGLVKDPECRFNRKHYTLRGEVHTFVVGHLFSGAQRKEDFQWFLEELMQKEGLELLCLSIDLADDPDWDVTLAPTFHKLRVLAEEALLDAVLGGPPCSSWSRLRFRPNGPRPLRFDWCLWGRPDLKVHETPRVLEANRCVIKALFADGTERRSGRPRSFGTPRLSGGRTNAIDIADRGVERLREPHWRHPAQDAPVSFRLCDSQAHFAW